MNINTRSISSNLHDIHLSLCEISLNPESNKEVTFKLFYDDIQAAVGLIPGEELPSEYKSSDDLLNKYIQENFAIYYNDTRVKLAYKKSSAVMPAVWSTFEIVSEDNFKQGKLKIYNNILIETYRDQSNIVKLFTKNKSDMVSMNKKKTSHEFIVE